MALLDIVQRVCDEVGLPRPAVVATSTDQLARQMFSLANAELEELSKRFDWPQLTREYTFPTVVGIAQYNLPADYRKFLSNTLYDMTRYYKMRGSVSPGEWQRTKSMNLGSLSCAKVRIYGNPLKLNVVPTPVSVENVVFEYLTENYAVNAGNAEIPRFTADGDSPIIDEGLIRMGLKWRIKHAKGLEFSADLAEYEGVVNREFAAAMAQPQLDVGYSRRSLDPTTQGYVPEQGFGS
jgi:hypothetical protein